MFTIQYERDHYAVYKDGVFYCSADTKHEAEAEVKAAETAVPSDSLASFVSCWRRKIPQYA